MLSNAHRLSVDNVEADVARIPDDRRVVAAVNAGDGAVIVFTEPREPRRSAKPGEAEQR